MYWNWTWRVERIGTEPILECFGIEPGVERIGTKPGVERIVTEPGVERIGTEPGVERIGTEPGVEIINIEYRGWGGYRIFLKDKKDFEAHFKKCMNETLNMGGGGYRTFWRIKKILKHTKKGVWMCKKIIYFFIWFFIPFTDIIYL